MAFPRENNITNDTIEDLEISFFVPGPASTDGVQSGNLDVQIGLSSGEILVRSYDLLDKLGDDAAGLIHLSNLADLKDYIIARLNAEVLP